MQKISVDIISDVVCPWCIVGFKQLEQAAQAEQVELDIHWHPFQLNPQMVDEGQNLREHLIEKYGISVEDSVNARERLKQTGQELNFDFVFSDESRIFNTFECHRLLYLAKQFGKQHDLKMALFSGYFTEQKNISDKQVLIDIAQSVGLDRNLVTEVMEQKQYQQELVNELSKWQQQGISSVPSMVFEQKYLVTGAQGVENYKNVIQQLLKLKEQA